MSTEVPQAIGEKSWDEVARAVLASLADRDISPDLAVSWLTYILDHVESGREIRFRTWPGDWVRK